MSLVGFYLKIAGEISLRASVCLILLSPAGCSGSTATQTLTSRVAGDANSDSPGLDIDEWSKDDSTDFDNALNLVSPANRVCTEKILKDYDLLIAVRMIDGPRNGQRVFGAVRMPMARDAGVDPISISRPDTIFCFDGREWQFDEGGTVSFKDLDLPRFVGSGGDDRHRFSIKSAENKTVADDLGKKFSQLRKVNFFYEDLDTKAKGRGKVDFRLRVLAQSEYPRGKLPAQPIPTPSPAPSPAPTDDNGPSPDPDPSKVGACLSAIQKKLDATFNLQNYDEPSTISLATFPACKAPITPAIVQANAKTCYGANDGICATCDDAIAAYRQRGWHFNKALFIQCSNIVETAEVAPIVQSSQIAACLSAIQRSLDATFSLRHRDQPSTISLSNFAECHPPITPALIRENANTCYGANDGVCATCDDAITAYLQRGWHYNAALFIQCTQIYN